MYLIPMTLLILLLLRLPQPLLTWVVNARARKTALPG